MQSRFAPIQSTEIKPSEKAIPVFSASGVNRAKALPAIRFGEARDMATPTESLPAWAKEVKAPQINSPKIIKDFQLYAEKVKKDYEIKKKKNPKLKPPNEAQLLMSRTGLKCGWNNLKLAKAVLWDDHYLPKESQEALRKYRWTFRYWSYVLRPWKADLMKTVYRGPIAIKKMQAWAELDVPGREFLRKWKDSIRDMPFYRRWPQRFGLFIATRLFNRLVRDYVPLKSKVPPLPYSQFKKQINDLKESYHKSHPKEKIQSVQEKPIGSGSIAQVYKATVKNTDTGQVRPIVIKVVKPNLTEKYLDGFRKNLYYSQMLIMGTDPKMRHVLATEAQRTIDILKEETHPEHEIKNMELMKKIRDDLGIRSFDIPPVLGKTAAGFIMPFVGEKSLAELDSKEQITILNEIGKDLIKFMVLSQAKGLDLHTGNVMVNKVDGKYQVHWIDHGRQANMNPNAFQKYLDLVTHAMMAPKVSQELDDWENMLLNPKTREKMEELLNLNASANEKTLLSLRVLNTQIDSQPDFKDKVIQQAKEQYKLDSEKQNVDGLGQFNSMRKLLSDMLKNPDTNVRKKTDALSTRSQSLLGVPSILNGWASCAMTQPGFSTAKLPLDDVRQYKVKAVRFLRPYLESRSASNGKKVVYSDEQSENKTKLAGELAESLLAQTNTQAKDEEKNILIKNISKSLSSDLY